jgi:hypothetical protein
MLFMKTKDSEAIFRKQKPVNHVLSHLNPIHFVRRNLSEICCEDLISELRKLHGPNGKMVLKF